MAIELARQASGLIMEFYENGFEIEEKIGVDTFSEPVTIADRLSSKLIVEGLHKSFPDDAILSEEEVDDTARRSTKQRVWMIDPIDGTKGFVEKMGDFAVQIGLAENGDPVLGVVLLPAHDFLYYASKNEGAFVVKNSGEAVRLQVSDIADFKKMTMVSSRNHHSKYLKKVSESIGLEKEIQRGSVGLKVGMIAERQADIYIHTSPRTKFWDTCAPQIILEEAGGKMTDIFGEKIRYDLRDVQNHNGVLASNGAAHEKAVAGLRPILAELGRLRVKAKTN